MRGRIEALHRSLAGISDLITLAVLQAEFAVKKSDGICCIRCGDTEGHTILCCLLSHSNDTNLMLSQRSKGLHGDPLTAGA